MYCCLATLYPRDEISLTMAVYLKIEQRESALQKRIVAAGHQSLTSEHSQEPRDCIELTTHTQRHREKRDK